MNLTPLENSKTPSHAAASEGLPADDAFGTDLDDAYAAFRLSLVSVLRDAAVESRSGTAIASELKVNRQLAWQLATIASERAASIGLKQLPGTRGMQRFADACAARPVAAERLLALRSALAALEDVVARHVGDRAELGLFAAAWEPTELERASEPLRRDGYRAQCALLGVRAETQIRAVVFAPSRRGDPNTMSYGGYQCFAGLTRLRRDRPCRLLYTERPIRDDGSPQPDEITGAVDMQRFLRDQHGFDAGHSTGDESELEYVTKGGRGWVSLRPGPVGRTTSSTLAFSGSVSYEAYRWSTPGDLYNHAILLNYVPTEMLCIDYLVHRDLAPDFNLPHGLSAACYDASTGIPVRPAVPGDPPLYALGPPEPVGPTELQMDTAVEPLFDIVDRLAQRLECRASDFVGVRFRTSYVMASTALVVERRLPAPPNDL
ncbi:MAG: hypothetical protein AAGI30_09020 [Planctomycetota bacterium]